MIVKKIDESFDVMRIGTSKMQAAEDKKFIELLKGSDLGHSLLSEVEQKKLASRSKLLAELDALNIKAESDYPKYEKMKADALAAVRAAEKELAEAQKKFWFIENQRSAESSTYDARRGQIEKTLRLDAAPEIDSFISEMLDEFHSGNRDKLEIEFHRIPSVSYYSQPCVLTNAKSIAARLRAIIDAIHAAEDLKLEADQSGVINRLAAIRARLPAIESPPPFKPAEKGRK